MGPKRRGAITYGKLPKRRRLPSSFFDFHPEGAAAMSWIPNKNIPEPLVPKRPNSQKAATMAVEPDQDSIAALCGMMGCDPETSRRYLRAKQNNLEQAANALIDGEDINKLESSTQWDESLMQADRDGNQNLHPLGTSAAPTRGPSPAPSLGITQPTSKDAEDSELARALAASRGEEMLYTQESGVVNKDGSEVKFGPATRDFYDQNQWAMVPASQEIVPDVPAKEREYNGQGPRFLKHLPDGDYTPNFITICHSIAQLREAFLMRDYIKSDYGSSGEWWRGQPISLPKIVNTQDGTPAHPDADKYDELITEMQRLMAFLDCSQRAYASIGGITQSDMIKYNEASHGRTLLELFTMGWMEAVSSRLGKPDAIRKLFTTTVGTNSTAGMADPNLRVVDLTVKSSDENPSLLELLDNLLWDTDPDDDEMPDNFIEEPADFLVMHLQHAKPDNGKLGVEIFPSIHIDKYLKKNIGFTRSIRQQMVQGKKRVAKIEEIEKKLKLWQHPKKSEQIEARKLLTHTLGHFSGQNRKDVDKADIANHAPLANDEPEPQHYPDVASKLEQIIASIDKKLAVLAEEKEKIRKAVSELSKAPPADLEESELQPRYILCGLATKPNITYVLQRKEDGDEDTTTRHDEDTTPPGHQWWRIDYQVKGSQAEIKKDKAADYDVLRAAELEHTSALLVYGNEEAWDHGDYYTPGLPGALREFVERDNQLFQQELRDADLPSYNIISNDMSDIPRKSIERTSMDSLKVGRDSDEEPLLETDELSPQQHYGYGLGYDVKSGTAVESPERAKTPVEEIHLQPDEDMLMPNSSSTEMMQKPDHEPLVPRPGTRGDTAMGGMESQDMGMGGATHVEDAGGNSK